MRFADGYWYKNNAVNPNMGSCMIALDRATRDNGCLQVLKGSCHLGRLDHGPVVDGRRLGAPGESESEGEAGVAEQHGADPERVELAQAAGCERLHCELEPGDAIFFHANTLHRSDELRPGADPRWALICCYNTKHNLVDDNPGHPSFRQLPVCQRIVCFTFSELAAAACSQRQSKVAGQACSLSDLARVCVYACVCVNRS